MPPNPELDRFTSVGGSTSDLSAWAETYGLTDLWKWRRLLDRSFTCHFATHKTLSRIDLMYDGSPLLPRVQQISILQEGILDHALLLLQLTLEGCPTDKLWRLSKSWISDPGVESGFRQQMATYWALNPGSAPEELVWDAFKASSRGHYQSLIGGVRRKLWPDLIEAEDRPASLERQYTQTKTPELHTKLQESTREVLLICTSLTKKK